jgi:hypothetical protein
LIQSTPLSWVLSNNTYTNSTVPVSGSNSLLRAQ